MAVDIWMRMEQCHYVHYVLETRELIYLIQLRYVGYNFSRAWIFMCVWCLCVPSFRSKLHKYLVKGSIVPWKQAVGTDGYSWFYICPRQIPWYLVIGKRCLQNHCGLEKSGLSSFLGTSRILVHLHAANFQRDLLYLTGSSDASGTTSEVKIKDFPREDGTWGCECVLTI